MYVAYFGLGQEPFSIAPDPRYLYMSERHREALAHLLYGLGAGGGFVLLSGEIGTGKTTVCRLFLEQIPANCNVAYIFNPKLTVLELLQSICDEFHIAVPAPDHARTVKEYLDPLNEFLLREHAAGRNNVLIIDEAQNLSPEVLEQLRLLTNLETSERKLLQIILIGQPELRTMLARPELEQLAQRVIARYHLDAMTAPETAEYIQHRLEVAGLKGPLPFDRRALQRVHELSRGVPRRVNLLCDRALLGAFANGRATADRRTVERAATEVFGPAPRSASPWPRAAAVLGLGLVAGAGLYAAATRWIGAPVPAVAVAARGPVPVAPPRAASAASAPASAASSPAVQAEPKPAAVVPVLAPASAAAKPALLASEAEAWRELATAWQVELPAHGDPCQALQKEGLQCFTRTLTLPLIRELGRPGILTLDAASGAPRYALLTALTQETATLRAGGSEQTVTLPALAARWQGAFSTLWKAPPGYSSSRGAADPATLEWMAAGLAKASGAPAPTGRPVLDAALRTQLKSFQTARGLAPDGQPGPMTFMQLNRAAGIAEPRLRTGS